MAQSVRASLELTLAVVLALPPCAGLGQDPYQDRSTAVLGGASSGPSASGPQMRSGFADSSLPGGGVSLSPLPSSRLYEPAETVGRVGEHFIFRGELIGDANLIMAAAMEKVAPEELEKNRVPTRSTARCARAAGRLRLRLIARTRGL